MKNLITQQSHTTNQHYLMKQPPKKRQREQRNVKRRTDWQNTCKDIEDKRPQVDNIPWEEADNKTKSHIYLSLGAQATNISRQRFPHTDIQKCTTDALVEQLREAFIQTRNETVDRYQFFRCRQKEGESLEVFHSRIKKHASVCNWDHLEESLVKNIERQNRVPILPTPQSGQIYDCRRCGSKFLPGHLNVCPAKNEICRICKKIGHFAKQCKSEMPPRSQYNPQQRRQQNYPGQQTYSGYHQQ